MGAANLKHVDISTCLVWLVCCSWYGSVHLWWGEVGWGAGSPHCLHSLRRSAFLVTPAPLCAIQAIDSLVRVQAELLDYSVNSVTGKSTKLLAWVLFGGAVLVHSPPVFSTAWAVLRAA